MDQIEKSVYNHLLAAESPQTGCVSYYTSLMDKKPYSCDITCCLSSVPRGISMIPQFNYGQRSGIPSFLLLESTEVNDSILTNNKNRIALSIKAVSDFPAKGRIVYTVSPSQASVFPLSFRIPGWSTRFTATVNGKKYGTVANGYLTISRLWEDGEKIIIDFDIPVKIIHGGHNYKDFIAFQRGPQVLSADSSLNHSYPLSISDKQLQFPKIILKEDSSALPAGWIGNQAYSITESCRSGLMLVPFADAGQMGSKTQVWIPLRKHDLSAKL